MLDNPVDDKEMLSAFQTIIENSFDGIFITDAQANTILVNKAYETITGLKKEEVLGKNMKDLVDQKVISNSGSLMVLKTGGPITLYQKFKTGKHALITSSPIYDSDQNLIMIETNVRDMTEIYDLKVEAEQNAVHSEHLERQLELFKNELMNYNIIAEDPATLEVLRMADKIKNMDTTVILLGETGVGKEVFAKYIYQNSNRSQKPFIKVNCGAIPENLIESELFGYEKGAFTGANRNGKTGLFELADQGTIFLDEIGELPLPMQVKLLRCLQEQEITRVGGTKPIKIDVRVIAATNRNLEKMVSKETFREDLYYRLMVFPLHIPPLRQRPGDIEPLVNEFMAGLNRKYGQKKRFSKAAIHALEAYHWPGNIRELKNIVERTFIISSENLIMPDILPPLGTAGAAGTAAVSAREKVKVHDLAAYIGKIELSLINDAYEEYGNVRDAAKSLGISAATFTRKRKKAMEKE